MADGHEARTALLPGDAVRRRARRLLLGGGRRSLGVCGLGGSGKTSACLAAASGRSGCVVLETDWYLRDTSRERRERVLAAMSSGGSELVFWSDPRNWYEWDRFIDDLSTLRITGRLSGADFWRQTTGERDLEISLSLPDPGVVLVDGIYLLHEPLRSELDEVILLELPPDEALARSERRDAHRSPELYLQFKAGVAEAHDLPYFARHRGAATEILLYSSAPGVSADDACE